MRKAVVLIIDDDPATVRLFERVLGRKGYKVIGCLDPNGALDLIKREKIDLLLTDILMPNLNGFDLIHQARQYKPMLAVIVITGFGTIETAIQALRQGVDGLILKPILDHNDLLQAVELALQEQKRREDAARLQTLRPLFDITNALLSETDLQKLAWLIVKNICEMLHCDLVGIYRVDAAQQSLILEASIGVLEKQEHISAESGLLGWAWKNRIPVLINHDGSGRVKHIDELRRRGLSSAICVSIDGKTEQYLIFVGRHTGNPPFRELDLEMLNTMARQAEVALENAHLYEEQRNYVKIIEDTHQALIQTEKMATVGRMVASISHEINNPLQSLQNTLHLVSREKTPLEQRKRYLKMAQTELDRLSNTIQRMLDFYRRGPLEKTPVNINEIIEVVLSLMNHQLNEFSIRVHTQLADGLPQVDVVINQIKQVFFNIVLNAIEAMPQGGDLTILSSRADGQLVVTFEDTGPGISEEMRARLFEPFVSTKRNGTGLGLSVSNEIMKAHGGSIEIAGAKGQGACIRVIFPI
jgi:signal transduction histidine kinase